ncbi:hypothetical protein [Devosia faecipullorum]|uniref:hypothetical protein n=1 Tax=Devosia faecipullorum TaxID=2755039 RepID=UPI00187B6DF8|nr:hypothetical protein [Devosia faecipullorum]MBE7732146.1 hypothetical protein [Devosia faecipullorum]
MRRKSNPAQLDMFAAPAAREWLPNIRSTAPAATTVPDLVKPGTVLLTEYRRYIVVAIVPSFYAPDRRDHYQDLSVIGAQGATDRLIPCFHFAMADEARFLEEPRGRSLRGDSYENRVIVKNGRLASLYAHVDHVGDVVGFNAVAARILAAMAKEGIAA